MLGTLVTAGLSMGARALKRKQRRRKPGLGFVSGGTGPVLFEDRTLDPGGGVLASSGRDVDLIEASVGGKSTKAEIDLETGEIRKKKRRRRRRRLLTCSDRADIAFITGVLGKGQTGQAAISTLLARCN